MSTVYHESGLSPKATHIHRALASLQEELEAADWYQQRADVAEDEELKAILLHNQEEEVEHASMLLEWLRRNSPYFDDKLRTYLFTEKPITELEAEAEEPGGAGEESAGKPETGSLRIGNLK